jgi:hypothetical protein
VLHVHRSQLMMVPALGLCSYRPLTLCGWSDCAAYGSGTVQLVNPDLVCGVLCCRADWVLAGCTTACA